MKYLFFIFITFTAVSAVKKSYDGYKVYKVTPKNDATVSQLQNLRENGLGEFWDDYLAVNVDATINVSPENNINFLEFLKSHDIEGEEVIADIQRAINNQMTPALSRSFDSYLSFSWSEYHNLDKIYAWLDELQENHPGVVKTVEKGQSVLGNPIKGIVINYHPERSDKLIGIIEGTLHAREWICTATVTWIIKEFLTSTDQGIRTLAENFEWHIFPVVNPDGYEYTFTDNRMWRKNRSPLNFTSCAPANDDMSNGVDLNRNFDFHWMTVGASSNPCTNTFAGPSPFSEPESRAIRDYTLKVNQEGKLIYYLAFHSFTQLIVIPYSHVTAEQSLLSGNFADMFEISIRAADALKKRFGTEYRVGLSSSVMYPMSGTSFDWVKEATNVPISLLLELRDLGQYGFLLPPDQIIPTGLETMDALVEMDRTARGLGYYSASAVGVYSSLAMIALSVLAVILG